MSQHFYRFAVLLVTMELSIAIPASLVSDIPHLREKTSHLGGIGRALAIFRVGKVIIYPDRPSENQRHDAELISTILSYMETPQYLRKHIFPMISPLRYASILPLRTPHHPLAKRIVDLDDGEYREGVVVKVGKEILIDIGVEHPIPLNEGNVSFGQRITVRVSKTKSKISLERTEHPKNSGIYWGYTIEVSKLTLSQILRRKNFDLVMLTSRYGKPLTEVIEEFKDKMRKANNVLICFGSPKQGLKEILAQDGIKIDEVNAMVINTVPRQGTETVRTEEAIYATLAVIDIIM